MRDTNRKHGRDVTTVTQTLTNARYHRNKHADRKNFVWVFSRDNRTRNFARKPFWGVYVRKNNPSCIFAQKYAT